MLLVSFVKLHAAYEWCLHEPRTYPVVAYILRCHLGLLAWVTDCWISLALLLLQLTCYTYGTPTQSRLAAAGREDAEHPEGQLAITFAELTSEIWCQLVRRIPAHCLHATLAVHFPRYPSTWTAGELEVLTRTQ